MNNMIDDETEPPPARDPRDYVGCDPLCACGEPACGPGSTVGKPHEYTPHPDTPASVEEHRAAIVVVLNRGGAATHGWPSKAMLWRFVKDVLKRRMHDVTYAQALASLKLTDAQWQSLALVIETAGAAISLRVGNELAARGHGSFMGIGRHVRAFFANDAGRARNALGRGPR